MINSGEWWLDDGGNATFADGDVGNANHEAVAYCAALRLPSVDEYLGDYDCPEFEVGERIFLMHPGDMGEDADGNEIPITPQNCLYLWAQENGAPKSALEFFGKSHADAREYAVRFMGWMRIKVYRSRMEVDVLDFDEKAFRHLRRSEEVWGGDWSDDGIPEGLDENDTIAVNEVKSGVYVTFPAVLLFKMGSVEQLIAYLKRDVAQWHTPSMDGYRGGTPLKGRMGKTHYAPRGAAWCGHDKVARTTSDPRNVTCARCIAAMRVEGVR